MRQIKMQEDLNGPTVVNYDVLDFDKRTEYIRSFDGNWGDGAKGDVAATYESDDSSVTIKIGKNKIKLDYVEEELLLAVLLDKNTTKIEIVQSAVVKST